MLIALALIVHVTRCTFRMQVEKHFVRKHRKSPYPEFLLLEDWSLSERLQKKKPCLLTRWGRTLATSKKLTRRILLSRLLGQARGSWTNVSKIEVGHGRNRKVSKRRVNSARIGLRDLSADHLGRSGEHFYDCVISERVG